MRILLQRVTHASVSVDGEVVAQVGTGLLVLVGVTHDDDAVRARTLAAKIATLRVMRDERSVLDLGAEVLVVSQFTLYADTRRGRRPSWSAAAPAGVAEPVIAAFVEALRAAGVPVRTGVFGADMRVELVNDGPVTLWVED